MKARKIWLLVLALLVTAGTGFGVWWKNGFEQAQCKQELRNYNNCVASCGMSSECTEAWKSPEATEKLVLKIFEKQHPTCPAGGKLTWVYGSKFQHHSGLPALVCSKHSP